MDTIGKRIKELRAKLKLSQSDFADKIDLKQNSIANIETERRNLSQRTINDICSVFKVNENWLVNGEGDIFVPLNEDEEIAKLMGRVCGHDNEIMKETFLKLSRMSLSQLKLISQMIDEVSKFDIRELF